MADKRTADTSAAALFIFDASDAHAIVANWIFAAATSVRPCTGFVIDAGQAGIIDTFGCIVRAAQINIVAIRRIKARVASFVAGIIANWTVHAAASIATGIFLVVETGGTSFGIENSVADPFGAFVA